MGKLKQAELHTAISKLHIKANVSDAVIYPNNTNESQANNYT
jgi:hypothetical protein